MNDERNSNATMGSTAAAVTNRSTNCQDLSSFPIPPEIRQENEEDERSPQASTGALSQDEVRTQHWRASAWAVGCVDPTWGHTKQSAARRRKQRRSGEIHDARSSRQQEFEVYLTFASWICAAVGAKRVGNMAILIGDVELGGEDGSEEVPRLSCVLGPYWPVNLLLVFPFVVALSLVVIIFGLPQQHPAIVAAWAVLTSCLLMSMVCVSCRDPGILRRHTEKPADIEGGEDWIWNDQALTYRPKKAKYDPECACIFEEFDHVCPWTGTAIAGKNICCFRLFVTLIMGTIVFDVILLVSKVSSM